MSKNQIEVIARIIIKNKDRILLCRLKSSGHYFLPGGHLEFNESLKEAIKREVMEEMGKSIKTSRFLGIVENIYSEPRRDHHEINLIYEGELKNTIVISQEQHIEFQWVEFNKLSRKNILPVILKKRMIRWLGGKDF